MRTYFWPYPTDFVPKGITCSRHQSSAVPSERLRALKEYAYAPLFGADDVAFSLGCCSNVKQALQSKPQLKPILASILRLDVDDITLGPLRPLSSKPLLTVQDPLRYRLDASGAVLATVLIDICVHSATIEEAENRIFFNLMQRALQTDNEPTAQVLLSLGWTYVECRQEDSSHSTTLQLGGNDMTDEEVDTIVERWDRRIDDTIK